MQTLPSGFNPTLVRLRPNRTRQAGAAGSGFNPTLVRLRRIGKGQREKPQPRFNPTLVRLRRRNPTGNSPGIVVSIPRWFD